MGYWKGYRGVALVFWILAGATVLLFVSFPSDRSGWDMRVYGNAIASLRAGHDPYLDGMAVQRQFHEQLAVHPHADLPYTYLYPPLTLLLLGEVGHLPLGVAGGLYWLGYVAAVFALAWAWMQVANARERAVFLLSEPAALFFPGLLLEDDVLFSGNIAYLIYAAIFVAAIRGVRRGDWIWFYASVLTASCFKFPMLSLLVIAVVAGRHQWIAAFLTGTLGVGLLAMQMRIWPTEFRSYLDALGLEFEYNHGFGTSLAGVAADTLYPSGTYRWVGGLVYVLYAVPVIWLLFHFSRRFMAGDFSMERWMPVVLVGALLLNPRLMEYDVAAITLPMAMILWRYLGRGRTLRASAVRSGLVLLAINCLAIRAWKATEALVLLGVFLMGCIDLRNDQMHYGAKS